MTHQPNHGARSRSFRPVSTVMPYKGIEEATALTALGKGSLVSSIVTSNDALAREFT